MAAGCLQRDVHSPQQCHPGLLPDVHLGPIRLHGRHHGTDGTLWVHLLLHHRLHDVVYVGFQGRQAVEQVLPVTWSAVQRRSLWWNIYVYLILDIFIRNGTCLLRP